MVIATSSIVVVMGMGAISIDMASWYQTHHQDQVAADAAALAAANCMANAGGTSTNDVCTSTTDTTDAASVAVQIAGDNGLTIPSSDVTFTASTVSVSTPGSAPVWFASLFGMHSVKSSAAAKATWTSDPTTCTAAAQSAGLCAALYAHYSTCSSNTFGISDSGGSATINGSVLSNGSLSFNGGGSTTFEGPVTYGPGCGPDNALPTNGKNYTYDDGAPKAETADAPWPIDYSQPAYFPACSSGGPVYCTGPGNTPSYCNYELTGNFNVNGYISTASSPTSNANGVYCGVGNGTPSNPSTWNATVNISGGGGTASVTFIASQVQFTGGNWTLTPYSDNLLAYAVSNQGQAFEASGGTFNYSGNVFVPIGTANLTGGNEQATSMIEADFIAISGGSITGDGPPTTAGSSLSLGNDYLTN